MILPARSCRYGLRIANVRLHKNDLVIEAIVKECLDREARIYAFVINGEIVRIPCPEIEMLKAGAERRGSCRSRGIRLCQLSSKVLLAIRAGGSELPPGSGHDGFLQETENG